ncbi:zf-CGNR multi-domain protein [Mycobacterium sp. PS03-16]|nr:zf-CGNR multi-domain protein [Mycobacterium sp. PS03-16]
MSGWTGDDEARPAPAPLDRVQSLVNTVDLEIAQDRLARRDDAQPWLVAHGWLAAGATLTDADLDLARSVREAVRALLIDPTDAGAVEILRAVAAAAPVRASLDDRGTVDLRAAGGTLAERLGDVLILIRDAQRDGTWSRLKACANHDCRWVFYDQSRNRGGSWCAMSSCGNRLKNRDFRARHRAAR